MHQDAKGAIRSADPRGRPLRAAGPDVENTVGRVQVRTPVAVPQPQPQLRVVQQPGQQRPHRARLGPGQPGEQVGQMRAAHPAAVQAGEERERDGQLGTMIEHRRRAPGVVGVSGRERLHHEIGRRHQRQRGDRQEPAAPRRRAPDQTASHQHQESRRQHHDDNAGYRLHAGEQGRVIGHERRHGRARAGQAAAEQLPGGRGRQLSGGIGDTEDVDQGDKARVQAPL